MLHRAIFAAMLSVAIGVLGPPAAARAQCAWNVIPSSGPGIFSVFRGVSAAGASDAWAVGYFDAQTSQDGLIEHWDGTAWSVVDTPALGTSTQLNAVAALSPGDVWAVGANTPGDPSAQTLVEHWNGASWSIVNSQNRGALSAFASISAASATDIWAVGFFLKPDNSYHPLAEHWDGHAWSVVTTPSPGAGSQFQSVAAFASNDVWAVGFTKTRANTFVTLTEHWDGTSWSVIPSKTVAGAQTNLFSVGGVSGSSIWAVGWAFLADQSTVPVTEFWNGSKWKLVATPSQVGGKLLGVADLASDDAWAVGAIGPALQWNGSTWSVVSMSPDASGQFFGIAPIPGTTSLWAVGGQNSGVLVEEFECT